MKRLLILVLLGTSVVSLAACSKKKLESSVNKLENELSELRQTLEDRENKLSELREKLEDTEDKLSTEENSVKLLTEEISRLSNLISELEESDAEKTKIIEGANFVIASIQEALDKATLSLQEKEAIIEGTNEYITELKGIIRTYEIATYERQLLERDLNEIHSMYLPFDDFSNQGFVVSLEGKTEISCTPEQFISLRKRFAVPELVTYENGKCTYSSLSTSDSNGKKMGATPEVRLVLTDAVVNGVVTLPTTAVVTAVPNGLEFVENNIYTITQNITNINLNDKTILLEDAKIIIIPSTYVSIKYNFEKAFGNAEYIIYDGEGLFIENASTRAWFESRLVTTEQYNNIASREAINIAALEAIDSGNIIYTIEKSSKLADGLYSYETKNLKNSGAAVILIHNGEIKVADMSMWAMLPGKENYTTYTTVAGFSEILASIIW